MGAVYGDVSRSAELPIASRLMCCKCDLTCSFRRSERSQRYNLMTQLGAVAQVITAILASRQETYDLHQDSLRD
jgi:hypothetical protein